MENSFGVKTRFFQAIKDDDRETFDSLIDHPELEFFDVKPYGRAASQYWYPGNDYRRVHACFVAAVYSLYALKSLYDRGHIKDVNAVDSVGNTMLHYACENRRFEIFEYLLSLPNIKVNMRNVDCRTPMEKFVRDTIRITRDWKTIVLFLKAGSELPSCYDLYWKPRFSDSYSSYVEESLTVMGIEPFRECPENPVDMIDRIGLAVTLMSGSRKTSKSNLRWLPDDLLKKMIKEYF